MFSCCEDKNRRRERPLPVRIGKRGFAARIKGNLRIDFGGGAMTSFAGLELVRRYLRRTGLMKQLREFDSRVRVGGDLRVSTCILVIVGIVLAILLGHWWIGLIIALIGLVFFGGFAKGKWY